MFNFMKKAAIDKDDKERRKRDKKDRKEKQKRDRASMSAEELLRLDEVRKSLKLTRRRKDKEKLPSGITADYTADFLANLEVDSSTSIISTTSIIHNHLHDGYTQSDSSETSLNSLNHPNSHKVPPPIPPKPPKRGILKTPRVNVISSENGQANNENLLKNTLQNELISYQNQNGSLNSKNLTTNLLVITSPSPSADSLTDTTNSSFATPPFSLSPVGESQGFHRWSRTSTFDDFNLPLPPIIPLVLPKARILTIQRQKPPRNDFGFSLRRTMILERSSNGVTMKAVVFAEPGTMVQHNNETGLLPGDKLLEVNGVKVEERSREEIIDLIKASGESVTLKVQPVAELSELSRRSGQDGQEIILDDSNIKSGTLRRSGSRRFRNSTTVSF
ncbi:pdz domain containing protein [Holotrichia oblita]|uniref:Pdz domain containing protein n=1 Tax=Holotrichia oblita TaxID=644536 RepID=A0ACB9SHB6_HOLOL|nr:pdz domain containing protein [Holotrichia oblita]